MWDVTKKEFYFFNELTSKTLNIPEPLPVSKEYGKAFWDYFEKHGHFDFVLLTFSS